MHLGIGSGWLQARYANFAGHRVLSVISPLSQRFSPSSLKLPTPETPKKPESKPSVLGFLESKSHSTQVSHSKGQTQDDGLQPQTNETRIRFSEKRRQKETATQRQSDCAWDVSGLSLSLSLSLPLPLSLSLSLSLSPSLSLSDPCSGSLLTPAWGSFSTPAQGS